MADTAIEWAESVWNPTTGCDRVSDGCDNCYALTMAARLKAMGQAKYQTDGDPRTSGPGFGLAVHDDALSIPLRWRKPRRVFINSMSDVFHDKVPDEFVAKVFAVMAATPQHTYQLLTKRHGRMRSLLSQHAFWTRVGVAGIDDFGRWLPDEGVSLDAHYLRNVHLGVSVENQQWADIRIPALLDTPAAVRWVSAEPLLGPVDLGLFTVTTDCTCSGYGPPYYMHEPDCGLEPGPAWGRLHWLVCGGESGPDARPMELGWARSLVAQCRTAGVPAFVKQLGSRWGREHHDIDQFPEDLRVREYPAPVADPGAINHAPADAVSSMEEVPHVG